MFSLKVVDTDDFLDMGQGSQLLYFHLAMRADDDGFVNSPKKIMRFAGAKDDDMKVLIGKQFILPFQSGVIVIKHWKEHNSIRKDRKIETIYKEEMALLSEDNNGIYELQPNDNQIATKRPPKLSKVKLSKVKLSKVKLINIAEETSADTEFKSLYNEFIELNPHLNWGNKSERKATQELLDKHGFEQSMGIVKLYKENMADKFCPVATKPTAFVRKMGDLGVYFSKLKEEENNKPKTIVL